MVSGPFLDLNKTIFVVKISIYDKSHNIMNIIYNMKSLQTVMAVGIVGINYQGRILKVATRVTDIPFVLSFLANF